MVETKEKIADVAAKSRAWGESAVDPAMGAAHTAGEKAKDAASGVIETVKGKVHDAAAGASDFAGKATDTAKEWASSVEDAAGQAKDKAQEMVSAAAVKAGAMEEEVAAFIRRYPLQSLLAGFAVGFLAAQMIRRS